MGGRKMSESLFPLNSSENDDFKALSPVCLLSLPSHDSKKAWFRGEKQAMSFLSDFEQDVYKANFDDDEAWKMKSSKRCFTKSQRLQVMPSANFSHQIEDEERRWSQKFMETALRTYRSRGLYERMASSQHSSTLQQWYASLQLMKRKERTEETARDCALASWATDAPLCRSRLCFRMDFHSRNEEESLHFQSMYHDILLCVVLTTPRKQHSSSSSLKEVEWKVSCDFGVPTVPSRDIPWSQLTPLEFIQTYLWKPLDEMHLREHKCIRPKNKTFHPTLDNEGIEERKVVEEHATVE